MADYNLVIKEDPNNQGEWMIEVDGSPGQDPKISVGNDDTITWSVDMPDPGHDNDVVVFQFPLGNKKFFKRKIIKRKSSDIELQDQKYDNFIGMKHGDQLEFTVHPKGAVPGGAKEIAYSVLVKKDCYLADGGSSPTIFIIIKDE